jgi:hypothetical protein
MAEMVSGCFDCAVSARVVPRSRSERESRREERQEGTETTAPEARIYDWVWETNQCTGAGKALVRVISARGAGENHAARANAALEMI